MMSSTDVDTEHHEQSPSLQTKFLTDALALKTKIEDYGNPFEDRSSDLLVLNSHDIMPNAVVQEVRSAREVGCDQYQKFVEERLNKSTKLVSDPIPRNKFQFFASKASKNLPHQKSQVTRLKDDCSLFANLYVASQIRTGSLKEFFERESQSTPPALAKDGEMRLGKKSDIVSCLIDLLKDNPTQSEAPITSAMVLDGPAAVHMLNPGSSVTFQDYAANIFMPYIRTKAEHVDRIDIVWDRYSANSLKQATRDRRGKGIRQCVEEMYVYQTTGRSSYK